MFHPDQYELVDFGHGMKWEKFQGVDVVRPCPAAIGAEAMLEMPSTASSYDKRHSKWLNAESIPDNWQITHHRASFNLKPTPFGHLGAFCEQAFNWDWIENLPFDLQGLKAINLFAYTGGTTLAMASKGAHVVHVDSARNVVNWARRNADSSGLAEAPIRWLVEDALKFVSREAKRGNKYDLIVADPPAIGHAGKRMTWKFERDIETLLGLLNEIAADTLKGLLLTSHTVGYDGADLHRMAKSAFGSSYPNETEKGRLDLHSRSGRKLNCGYYCRSWTAGLAWSA